jgi:hypothetical protein
VVSHHGTGEISISVLPRNWISLILHGDEAIQKYERSSGTLPTRIQILVLTPFLAFSKIYRRYALSGGNRHSRWRQGAIGDFGNL